MQYNNSKENRRSRILSPLVFAIVMLLGGAIWYQNLSKSMQFTSSGSNNSKQQVRIVRDDPIEDQPDDASKNARTGRRVDVEQECRETLMRPKVSSDKFAIENHVNTSFSSQYGQDVWAFYTLFYRFYEADIQGTYVDLAAALPRYISNTFFFDLCLGWDGLCIEGDPAKEIYFKKSIRSCKFISAIIDEKRNIRKFSTNGQGLMNGILPDTKEKTATGDIIKVETKTLSEVFASTKLMNVDFFSLDLEAYEAQALRTLDFTKYKIDVFIVERGGRSSGVYEIMMKNGYRYLGNLGPASTIDILYIRKGSIWDKHCKWDESRVNDGKSPVPECSSSLTANVIQRRFIDY